MASPNTAPAKTGLGTVAPCAGPRDPLADRATYALARLFLLLFRYLPFGVARWIGRHLGDAVFICLPRARQKMIHHMDIAYRHELSREEKERICRLHFRHMGLCLVEFSRLHWLTKENAHEWVDLAQIKVLDELLAKGRGVIAVPGHMGNWELCGYVISLFGYPLRSVARPIDNPLLNEMVFAIRETSGHTLIRKWQVLWKLKKLLDRRNIVAMQIDQNGGAAGIFAPFFGIHASTVPSPADLHLATRAPIIVATVNRLPDGVHHVLNIWDVIEFEKTGDHEADRLAIVTRINAAYEKAIRSYPEQWLWSHKRWKTRPEGERPGPDGLPPRIQG